MRMGRRGLAVNLAAVACLAIETVNIVRRANRSRRRALRCISSGPRRSYW
jgi:hypothetical protein